MRQFQASKFRRGTHGAGPVLAAGLALAVAFVTPGQAQIKSGAVDGEIEFLFLDDPSDVWSSGSIVLSGQTIVIPRNIIIQLPANWLTLQQIFEQAPPDCLALGESGLARTDGCVRGKGGGFGHVLANQLPDGTLVAGEVFLQKGTEVFTGVVTFIDHTDGYFRCNGNPADAANTGTMIRMNDPEGIHTIQQGLGCDGGPNCSPDPRFTNDPENYTLTFSTGYPLCIPSTVTGGSRTTGAAPDGTGDPFCPASNRGSIVAADSRFFAPLQLGDHISCEGNAEVVLDRATGQEISFLSVHTLTIDRALHTLDTPDQPDYVIFEEVEWDAPGFQNERSRLLLIGFSTLPQSEVTVYALDRDPATGENNERLLSTTVDNPLTQNQGIGATGQNIWKIHTDVDFITGAPVNPRRSPCTILQNAGFAVCPNGRTLEEEFAIISPLTREIIGKSRHRDLLDPGITAVDIHGDATQHGMYLTPIGVGHPEFGEINLDGLDTPFIFTGENWNLDRRLGPAGCVDADGDGAQECESLAATPLGDLRLDPFPFSALDAIGQVTALPPANIDRVYHHFPFGPGDSLQAIADGLTLANSGTTPGFLRGPALTAACENLNADPVVAADSLATPPGTPLVIAGATLLANDTDSDLDALSITAVGSPTAQGGAVASNGNGTWTYTPPPGFTGVDLFTYSVADAHGGSASGTVTISVSP